MKNLKSKIKKLPKNPGVYIFKDKLGKIVYIGKATNLRSRVSSYFRGGEAGRLIGAFIQEIEKIETQETESVLEALILEANLIQKYQPKYNVMGKDDKSFSYFIVTKEEFPRVVIVRETDIAQISNSKFLISKKISNSKIQIQKSFGPYISKWQMEIALKIIRKIFPFHSLSAKTEKGCLDFQLGRCPGPYAGAITKKDYVKNIHGIELILAGKKKRLLATLEKEMKMAAKKNDFEKAAELRNKVFALNHVRDVALMSDSVETQLIASLQANLRIEAYDISNISGQHAVGSMVVFQNSELDKAQYRKFKIRTVDGVNDVGMMAEVLFRRFRNAWPQPDLILLDGGVGHLNMAQKVLRELDLKIPLAAMAKGPSRKGLTVHSSQFADSEISNILKDKNLIKRIMDEAHRFAIGYHRKIRRKNLLS